MICVRRLTPCPTKCGAMDADQPQRQPDTKTPPGQGRRSPSVLKVLHLCKNPLVLHLHFGGVLHANSLICCTGRILLGSPLVLMINQQLGAILVSFCHPNRVAQRCGPVTTIPRRYRQLQTGPRNTSATRPFLLRSHRTGIQTPLASSFLLLR
jgi:hypothetical protein